MSAQPLPAPLPPLPADTSTQLQRLLPALDSDSLWWVSGYAAGLAQARRGSIEPVEPPLHEAATPRAVDPATSTQQTRLSIIYGSQTGNARRQAEKLAAEAEAAGLRVRLARADAYPLRELKDEKLLYVVVSTQGEGDPPEDAQALFEFLDSRRAPALPQLRYAVLGLGDSSYAQFNAAARRIDARLAALGGTALFGRGEADVDVETIATPWLGQALSSAREALRDEPSALPSASVTPLRRPAAAVIDRDHPVAVELIANQRLSGRDSAKDVRHLELDLAGSGLSYEPGDALGVWPENPPALVDELLSLTGLDGDREVALGTDAAPLRDWLGRRRELTRLSRGLLTTLAESTGSEDLATLLADRDASSAWLASHQSIDALSRWRSDWSAESLVAALRPLTPRLYSIASSRAEVGDEAHLTVDVLRYAQDGRIRVGAASSFLARQGDGAKLRVYVEPNERFRLPADGSRDLIMIGPGTGVAPFRGFLQQRVAAGASGRHWLLFGAQHRRQDFLYQTEWLELRRRGALARLDVAFSRDQPQKVYVQQRLREAGRELFGWLEGGAQLYVCGAIAMGRDVHAALIDVIAEHGGRDREAAEDYLRALQQAGRYAKDVY
jgi:sulfite reductase (NADPH) flavoprotein alpha-component